VAGPVGEAAWAPTRALGRAVLLTGVLAIGGVALGRVDLVLLAAPFALGTAWLLRRRPELPPQVAIRAREGFIVEGGPAAGTVSAVNLDRAGYDLVVLRTEVSPWLAMPDTDRPYAVAVPPRRVADLELAGATRRWGRHRIGPATATAYAAAGLLVCPPVAAGPVRVKVYPKTEPFDADEAMPRAAGLAGAHRSRQPGEGGELAGVRVYAPGDRLRRIDWRVSLRTRQLHVAATLSDRDAEVVLLLDVLAEAGRSGGVHGSASVLDTTVRAAAAIAGHYLRRGDRVSMVEFGAAARRLRPASGRRQYLTVLEWLLDVRAKAPGSPAPDTGPDADAPHEPYEQVFGPHPLSGNALIAVLTPLVDRRTAPMLARLARSGRHVIAVDTLPPAVPAPKIGAYSETAYRLWRLERDNTVGALREHGVPVVPWAGAGSLDQVLRDVSRLAVAPKVGAR
jgi:uncharacterized protein (DUF58 family)